MPIATCARWRRLPSTEAPSPIQGNLLPRSGFCAPARRAESKGAKILELIGRPKGASLSEIMKATDWQAHYADVRIMPTCAGNPVCGAGIAAMESA